MQVNSHLLIPNSPGSASTPLTLYYNAFYRPHWGGKSHSLHMSKPPQFIFAHFREIVATPSLSLNSWFLIQPINVCPHIHLSIRISVTSILCSTNFFTYQHSVPYSRAGLIAAR